MSDNRTPLEESRYEWLDTESYRWKTLGLLDDESRSRLLELYEPVVKKPAKLDRLPATEVSSSRVVSTITTLGSVLLGLGVILFFASNWEELSDAMKLGLLFSSLIASYYVGYELRYERETYPKVGDSLLVLGGILYGAGIWLIAQIFNIHGNTPNGILAWWLGVLPVALALRSEPLLVLASALASLWCCWASDLGEPRFVFLPLWAGLLMPLVYWMRSRSALVINLVTFTIWLVVTVVSHTEWNYVWGLSPVPNFFLLVGVVLMMTGLLHERRKDEFRHFTNVYIYIGYILAMGTCYWLTFEHSSSGWYGYSGGRNSMAGHYAVAGMAMGAAAAAMLLWLHLRRQADEPRERTRIYSLLVPIAVATIFAIVPLEISILVAILFNLLFAGMAAGGLLLGFDRQSSRLFNASLGWFVLLILTRYFDWFYAFMPRSLFFMGGGLGLLLGGGYLERRRREVIGQWRD